MHCSSFFIFFSLVASLVSGVVATTLYRGDTRGPKTIKNDGGFRAKGFDSPEGTLFEHAEFQLQYPSRDPFISTSIDIEVARRHAGNGYLYTIDSEKIANPVYDLATEYEEACRRYGHADEKEFSVRHMVPWAAITKVERKRDGEWKNLKMPTKRAVEFPGEDVFVE